MLWDNLFAALFILGDEECGDEYYLSEGRS